MAGAPGDLIQVLQAVAQLLGSSQESPWASLSPRQILKVIDAEIEHLKSRGKLKRREKLVSLFAPAGDIQEISITSGWAERYVELCSQFDKALAGSANAA